MENLFKNNGYHILGLDTSATQKDITKRSKDIIKLLQIDDIPQYDLDLGIFDNFRTEDTVKDAVQKLTSPKKQIKDYFFWFRIADDIDEQAVGLLRKGEHEEAIRVWDIHSAEDNIQSLFHKKNLAILYCILLFRKSDLSNYFIDQEYLKKSVLAWKELVNSDKFYNSFTKVYRLDDELNVDQDIIDDFRKQIAGYISDVYTELSSFHKNNEFITAFSKDFGLQGQKIETEVLNPIYKVINETIEKLEAIEIKEGMIADTQLKETIKSLISTAQVEFNKLVDLELYDSTQVKVIRDKFSEIVRKIVLDLHNKLNEFELSKKLLEVAIAFCGTEGQKNRLTQELGIIEKHVEEEKNSVVTLEIPSTFSKNYITFTNHYVEYQNKRINYEDATSVLWSSTKHSMNGIPTSQSYEFKLVSSNNETIKVSFSAAFRGGEKHTNTYGKIVGISNAVIEPVIVKKLVADIFEKGMTIKIGSININNRGYSHSKFFGGIEEVLWPDVKYKGKLHQGNAWVFEEKKGKAKSFASAPMSSPNGVLVPELIDACLIAYGEYVKR